MEYIPLEIPYFFEEHKTNQIWEVPYQKRAREIRNLKLFDAPKTALLLIDEQNSFCIPSGGLYVKDAEKDTARLCKFIYRNIPYIDSIITTFDFHEEISIFSELFWVDFYGLHPDPGTMITYKNIIDGEWKVNPNLNLGYSYSDLSNYVEYYTKKLEETGKFTLTIWPYHCLSSGIGSALVSSIDEAVFTHSIFHNKNSKKVLKGREVLSESYSLNPEVSSEYIKGKENDQIFRDICINYNCIIIAGQAKSHCVAYVIKELESFILKNRPDFINNIYILEDCMSPVVIPEVVDFTDIANQYMNEFKNSGMNIVRSDENFMEGLVDGY